MSVGCFNPRARVGRDLHQDARHTHESRVSIHAPAWGATAAIKGGAQVVDCFNPRARVGRDRHFSDVVSGAAAVSIHAPAWGATSGRCATSPDGVFQSTRPRGARPCRSNTRAGSCSVSIHAPAWGATVLRRYRSHDAGCFNPRARVGRDTGCGTSPRPAPRFQSTRPRGARPAVIPAMLMMFAPVSIHAPAWGATLSPLFFANAKGKFQSTRPRGARRNTGLNCPLFNMFQSTRPRGARHGHRPARSRAGCFNPRARVGRDMAQIVAASTVWCVFQSTRPRGARPQPVAQPGKASTGFNPRARVGRDASAHCCASRLLPFQSTRPRGARHAQKWTG